MIRGRYTTEALAHEAIGFMCADEQYADWYTVRRETPPRHLSEYVWAVVFEAPDTAALVLLHPEQLTCPNCHGDGEIPFNPSSNNDPQCEDSARCPDCNGDGLSYRARSAAA